MAINPFFNAEYYLAKNNDLIGAGLHTAEQLWNHYEQFGAEESTVIAARAPNPWFNVNYYLATNPDLNAAGLTAADALNHYAQYGLVEGREFNSVISVADFDADTYAADNADLREAFGIEEDAELTQEQEDQLFAHYLSYGYAEDRKGAGDIANFVQADNVINIEESYVFGLNQTAISGTIMNDKFVVSNTTNTKLNDKTIDGLGGDDTVVFKTAQIVATGTPAPQAVTLKNVEKVQVTKDVVGNVEFNSANVLDKITLDKGFTGAVTANFATAAVAGSADVLNVVANNAATLTTNGIETVNLELGKDVAAFTALNANTAKGDTLTVNLEGGATTGFTLTAFNTVGSTALKNIVIDGSELAGKFVGVALTGQALNVTNITVKGSNAEANTFAVTGPTAANNLTLVAGSKGDAFSSTAAIDTFVAGAGKDTFTITGGSSTVRLDSEGKKIAGVDTIENFGAGDTVVTGVASLALVSGSILETESEFLTYISTDTNKAANKALFEYDGDTYVFYGAAADALDAAQLIKLAGVSIDSLKVDAAGVLELA